MPAKAAWNRFFRSGRMLIGSYSGQATAVKTSSLRLLSRSGQEKKQCIRRGRAFCLPNDVAFLPAVLNSAPLWRRMRITLFVSAAWGAARACAAPKLFQGVVRPRLGLEQMDDHVAVVQQNPAALFVSFDSQPAVAHAVFQGVIDLLAHGVELAAAGAGGQHEVVEDRGEFAHVEHDDVDAAIVFGGLGGQSMPFEERHRTVAAPPPRIGLGSHSCALDLADMLGFLTRSHFT